MIAEVRTNVVDGQMMKWLFASGLAWLEQHEEQINEMNVFPVPDGDTGTNMVLTMRSASQHVADMDTYRIDTIMNAIATGALSGGRGNSGTILSMLLRGFASALQGADVMDKDDFIRACRAAVDYTYDTVSSVMQPVEGTILTVAKDATLAIEGYAEQAHDLRHLFDHMVAAAKQSLQNTPNLLPKLKEAGVVDSGGMGLYSILEGIQRCLDGEPVSSNGHSTDISVNTIKTWQDALVPEDEEGYGYDVQFLMHGENLDVRKIRQDISTMGWSPLIDGTDTLIKVHIHVHDPGEPLSYAIQQGVQLDDIVVENMQRQYQQYVEERQQREDRQATPHNTVHDGAAVIAVVRGEGLQELFLQYGAAQIIIGGQTMNPSVEDFLSAIESINNREIILLPNNKNIILAAETAAQAASGRNVRVIPTQSMQEGVAAVLAYTEAEGDLDTITAIMSSSFSDVVSGEITVAVRDSTNSGIQVKQGDLIGMVNGKLIASSQQFDELVHHLLDTTLTADFELVTLYYGAEITPDSAESLVSSLRDCFDTVEFEVVYGGQPLYPYLISIE